MGRQWLLLAVLAVGCSDSKRTKADKAKAPITLEARCEQVGVRCGDATKRDKLVDECKRAAADQTKKGCDGPARVAYDCYEKDLCGKGEAVWALDDFRVLAERHHACTAERDALRACEEK